MSDKKLYFVVFKDHFKLGITDSPKSRITSLINEKKIDGINFEKCFFYEFETNVASGLENSLKKKYPNLEKECYVSECFNLEYLESMENDILEFIEIFNIDNRKIEMPDEFLLFIDEETGNYTVKGLKQMWIQYKFFKKHEKRFDKAFKKRLEQLKEN